MPNGKEEGAVAPAVNGSADDAPEIEPDPVTLAKDRRLTKECQGLRSDLRLLMGALGLTARTQIGPYVAQKAAAPPEDEAEPEPVPETAAPAVAREAALWRLVAQARPVDPAALFDVVSEAVADVRDGVCLDEAGAEISPETVRAALPRFVAPTPGAGGGSGGRSPMPLPSPPLPVDPVEGGITSQKYYEKHRDEIIAAQKAGQ